MKQLAPAFQEFLLPDVAQQSCGHTHHDPSRVHVTGNHGTGAHEGLLADLDTRHQHYSTANTCRPPHDGGVQFLSLGMAPHGVVVCHVHTGAKEDVVLHDRTP